MNRSRAAGSGALDRRARRAGACGIGALCLLLVGGCDFPGRSRAEGRPTPADQIVEFNTLYGTHCIGCHGSGGSFGPAPPLNDPLFRAGVSREELVRTITAGRRGTPMPGFSPEAGGTLTTTQIEVLIAEIKGTPYRIDRAESAKGVELRVVSDPAGQTPTWGPMPGYPQSAPEFQLRKDRADRAQVGRGDRVFEQACSGCHGADGTGGGAGAINDPAFLSLISDGVLRRIIITGRHDLGMPDYSNSSGRGDDFQPLTTADVDDLVAFLQQWRNDSTSTKK